VGKCKPQSLDESQRWFNHTHIVQVLDFPASDVKTVSQRRRLLDFMQDVRGASPRVFYKSRDGLL
jgi:hypothetical protein